MNRRRVLALGALLTMLALSGCFGSSDIPEDQLTEDASYDWETNATVAMTVDRSSYETVVNISNRSTLRVYQTDALGSDQSVDLRSLEFRYRNGTVLNATHGNLSATRTQDRTVISLPGEDGQVAYTASRSGKRFVTPVFTDGDYDVTLPPNARVGVPLLSQVSPGSYETSVSGDRMTLHWENLEDGSIDVQYYLERDLLLFSLLLLIVLTAAVGGGFYYWRSIRRAKDKREELGLDVDVEDDDRDEPPPGMR